MDRLFVIAALWVTGLALPLGAGADPARCARVVSLAPSITETLYALGLGARVVGVTRYCRYPEEARRLPKVGGFLDPSVEAVVGLRPDLVVTLAEQGEVRQMLRKAGLEVLELEHRTVRGILDSFDAVGARCGVTDDAKRLSSDAERRIAAVEARVRNFPRVRALVALGGDTEDGVLRSIFVSGRDGYYSDLLRLAGGENVVTSGTISMPGLSAEGILAADPDVILQVMASPHEIAFDRERILDAWRSVKPLRAARNNRVYVLTEDYAAVPGPRFVDLLERFAHLLHPKA